jgi:hypothetical protein
MCCFSKVRDCFREIYNEEIVLFNDVISERRAVNVEIMGAKINAHKILVGEQEGKRPPERPGHRWIIVLQ